VTDGERIAIVEVEVASLEARSEELRTAVDEGRRIVLPLQATVATQGAALLRIEETIRADLREIRELLERRGRWLTPVTGAIRESCSLIAGLLRIVAENERGQIRWVALVLVAVAAIVWGVPIALDWRGVEVGVVADTDG
jgi:hypothetical protein